MSQYLETAFSGPPLPASCLLVLVIGYWLMVIVGMLDMDMLDLDLDMDVDADVDLDLDVDLGADGVLDSALSIGMLPLKWLNIGRVPLMLWVSVFALSFWLTSMLWDTPAGRENGWNMAAVILRNGAIALLCAKVLTQPIRGVFSRGTDATNRLELVGQECQLTARVTDDRGQAKVDTGKGAPVLLSVRCDHGELEKGERAQIVGYDPGREIYLVRRMPIEV